MPTITKQLTGKPAISVEVWMPDVPQYASCLLFVHGSFGGAWMWEKFLNYFSARGFTCYAPTLRGHNKEASVDLAKVRMRDYVQDVARAARLAEKPPVLIGHSLGGLVVLMYAAKYPVQALIAIDPSPPKEAAALSITQAEIEAIPSVYGPKQAGLPQDPAKVQQALPDMPEELLKKLPQMLGQESGLARKERKYGISVPPEKIKAPLLVIAAQKGDSVPFGISQEQTQKTAKVYDADLEIIQGATHPGIIMGLHWQQAAQTILRWLNKLSL